MSDSGKKWFKTDFPGVRYRKHPTRRHGVQHDKYFVLTYKVGGKTVSEGIGWASEGIKASGAYKLLAELKQNQRTGNGPRTLAKMREAAEAERLERERKQRAEQSANVTFKQFFEEIFLPDAKSRWTPETAEKAAQHVKVWIDPVTGALPFRELGLKHVNRIKANLAHAGRSPRMIQYVCRTFSMVWRSAKDHGIVDAECPTKSGSFRLPKVDNAKQRYLTVDEETTLLDAVKKRSEQAHDMAVVALDAALRFGEIGGLTWGCVDTENRVLRILNTKTGRDRWVPMTERLKALFPSMERGKSGDLVFPAPGGGKHCQAPPAFVLGMADAGLNEGVTDRKLRASFHTLRHTGASRLVQAGVDLYRVQRILGHSTPATTSRYAHLSGDDLSDAIKRMELHRRKKGAKIIQLPQAAAGSGQ